MDYWAKTLKNSLKSMPRDALQTRQLATLYGCSTEALRQCTTSSSQPSRSRVRACAMPLRANQGCGLWRVWALGISERRCLSAASFDVHPQWPYATKLPRRGRSPARRGMAHALARGDQLEQAKHRSKQHKLSRKVRRSWAQPDQQATSGYNGGLGWFSA